MRRVLLWLVLAVTVAVAGCGSLTAGSGATEPTETVSPVAVPTTETTSTPVSVAPGLAADRVLDYSALVESHASAINSTSHTYRERVTRRYPNGTVWREYTTFIQRNRSEVRYRYNWTSRGQPQRATDRWLVGNRTYVAQTNETGTTVTVQNTSRIDGFVLGTAGGYASSLDQFLQLLNVTVDPTETERGRQRYRLATPEPRQLSPSQNVTFVGYVTPESVFTSYRLQYQIVRGDIAINVTVDASFEGIGSTTVTRPPWADRIPLETSPETPAE